YFADKETLFQELARSMLSPFVGNIEAFAAADIPFPKLIDALAEAFVRDVIGTRRKDIIRLIISEGARFPSLAEFYHREVLSRVIVALRAVLQRAYERGELRHKSLIEFPQLLAAPGLVAIVWNSLFASMAPIDARAMLKAHLDILFDRGSAA
ncbi:MAG: TetR-like C-terminal domain-containing protein, partial [Pseudorhodoplanes sp.]